jgi:hypothetical protein
MKTEIIENPNGTYAIYNGNQLVSDGWRTREYAETSLIQDYLAINSPTYADAQAYHSATGRWPWMAAEDAK